MSKKMAGILVAYGIALAALGLFIQQNAPASAQVTFITGTAGGALCVLWGIFALAGSKRRTGAVLTISAVMIVVVTQTVHAWLTPADATSTSVTGRLLLTSMFLMTLGMLLYVLHGERPAGFYDTGAGRRENGSQHGHLGGSPGTGRCP